MVQKEFSLKEIEDKKEEEEDDFDDADKLEEKARRLT